MHLTPYRVVATGNTSGMIEVILNAETTANIQKVKSFTIFLPIFINTSFLRWLVVLLLFSH